MKAIVTGCAGFIGAHLSNRLIADGWTVIGIDALRPFYSPSEKLQAIEPLSTHSSFEFVEADLVEAPLTELMQDRPVVFHLAAQAGVRGSFGDTFGQYVHDNIIATQRLFETALSCEVPRVVYASSSSVYGNADAYPCAEARSTPMPVSPYGVTKLTCERLADVYRGLGLDAIGLRYFTVYGPNQRPDMAMRRLCEAALGGPAFQLFGDGLQSRDFTHVSDAVQATMLAAGAEDSPPVINVGGGQEATLAEVIEIVSGLAGRRTPIVSGRTQRGDVRRTGADISLAGASLGWEPVVGLVAGLATELEWVRQRRSTEAGSASLPTPVSSSNPSAADTISPSTVGASGS